MWDVNARIIFTFTYQTTLKPHVNTIKIHYNCIFKIYKIDKSLCIKLCVAHTFRNKNSKCLWTVIYNSTLCPDLHIFPHNDREIL